MKQIFSVLLIAASVMALAAGDPTTPNAVMADRLMARLTDAREFSIHALVVGKDGDGAALVGRTAEDARVVRRGTVIPAMIDEVKVETEIAAVTADGIKLKTASLRKPLFLPGGYRPLPLPADAAEEFVSYLEANAAPIAKVLRLVSDQAGVNISSSEAASRKSVSIFLRNVTADAAVEEICRATGLWFRREPGAKTIRVTTMQEYADNLSSFREETTESFTLLYPNCVEVASVIYGVYPDRTLLSLGEDDFDEDEENELARRFRRFRAIEENGGSSFMEMRAPNASVTGSSTGGGTFSYSRGQGLSRLTQWDELNDRGRRRRDLYSSRGTLSASEAELIDYARMSGNTNLLEYAKGKASLATANIFITLSRRNNKLIVRTSDVKAMDEIRRLVKELDVPTPMVLMEVQVLEIALNDDYQAGFTWSLKEPGATDGALTHVLGRDNKVDVYDAYGSLLKKNLLATAAQTGMDIANPTFSFQAVSDYVRLKIEAMQKDGHVKTLATPTLLVANNEVSRIFSGKEYPLVTGWTAGESVTSQSGVVTVPSTVSIEKKDVGTMLMITPNINADRTVTLRLLQENSEVSPEKVSIPVEGSTTDGGDVREIEYVESRSLAGTFVAKDDMLVMAGGLIKESEEEIYWRTPVLGSLPLVGWLFRGTEKAKSRTELIVLIKPHVVSTPMEGGKISEELLKRISVHPAADGKSAPANFTTNHVHDLRRDLKTIIER